MKRNFTKFMVSNLKIINKVSRNTRKQNWKILVALWKDSGDGLQTPLCTILVEEVLTLKKITGFALCEKFTNHCLHVFFVSGMSHRLPT